MKQIQLVKGRELFRITYEEGCEAVVLDELIAMVNRMDGFDWFDVAVLSHQLGIHLAKELKSKMPPK